MNFFKKKKLYKISSLFPGLKFKNNYKINNICTLSKAEKFDLTFFDSTKYKSIASVTKASYCITTEELAKFLPNNL